MFPVGMIVNNWAVTHNVAMFSELSFAVRWHGRLRAETSTMSISMSRF